MAHRNQLARNQPGRPARTGAHLRASALRLLALACAICVCLFVVEPPARTYAEPGVPDIDSLIDDSGPVPDDANPWAPPLLFNTTGGLNCIKSLVKVVWDLACAGDFPGAPAGTRVVTLSYVGGTPSGPAQFRPTPFERFTEQGGAQGPVLLPAGHKIRFFNYADTKTLVCGVPPSADLVCLLRDGGALNGFVIASPQSHVF